MQTSWAALSAIALTTWLGLHAIRTSLAMVVWNIGRERPSTTLILIALAIWLAGLLTAPIARSLGGTRPAARLAAVFGLLATANAFAAHPILTPLLGEASLISLLWLVPALVIAIGRASAAGLIVCGVAVGLAAQVAMQHALHGMDLPMMRGVAAGMETAILAAALLLSTGELPVRGREDAGAMPGWGLAALGPFLVLQFTVLANLGRLQMLTAVSASEAAGLILLGLLGGCALLGRTIRLAALAAMGTAVILILAHPAWLQGPGVWLVAPAQGFLIALLGGALAPAEPSRFGRLYGALVLSGLVLLLMLFLFYSRYGWPGLWPVAAAMVALAALARRGPSAWTGTSFAVLAALLVGGLGIGVNAATQHKPGSETAQAPPEITILTYNIQMGFDARGIPAPEAQARAIEKSGADLIALQEVGRGWTVNGGVDLVTWLQWRLPKYHLIYGPMNGDLWGNVILSRFPVGGSGWVRFPIRTSTFQRGLVWAAVHSPAGDLIFINTHFSAFAPFAEERLAQAGDLLQFWKHKPRTIVAGDFNAPPDGPVTQRLRAAGLHELTAPLGLGMAPTYSALTPQERIDYLWATPEIDSLAASIPRVTASDHLPVMATVRLR